VGSSAAGSRASARGGRPRAHRPGRGTNGGSVFDALPAGYDLHVLKWILHESCRTLLEACRAALPAGGRLLVIEQLLPDSIPTAGRLHPAVAMDLTMLVSFADAHERRLDEYEELLASGGFAIGEVLPLRPGSPCSRPGTADPTLTSSSAAHPPTVRAPGPQGGP
jgi:O-methyltransferase domain